MNEIHAFAADLTGLAKDLTGPEMESVVTHLGEIAKDDGKDAVRADIGDLSMSHWNRGRPIQILADYKAMTSNSVNVRPFGRTRGQWSVLTFGRGQGQIARFHGPGVNVKTGETARTKSGALRKVKARKARKWSGYTAGKDTWNDFEDLVEKRTPDRAMDAITGMVVKRLG